MGKRKLRHLRVLACLAALLSAAAYGCSLGIDTDGLTGGLSASGADGGNTDGATTPLLEAGSSRGDDDDGGGSACPGGGTLGTSTSCGACGFDCGGGACVDGLCQPVTMAIAGQGRSLLIFGTYGLVWSTVTMRNTDQSDACAAVTPLVQGLAASSTLFLPDGGTDDTSVFKVSSSGASAYYASALSADTGELFFQDTSPTAGVVQREVGFGNLKKAASVDGKVFGCAEPAAGNVMVYFADSTSTPGLHEFGADAAAGVDTTTTLPLDPYAPPELHTPYETASLAVDQTWAYYGTAAGVYRIKLGSTCADGNPDAGNGKGDAAATQPSDAGSSCAGLFIAEPSTAPVTVLMVDAQYLFVGTGDGALIRYNLVDASQPLALSMAGPFYGLTQDVNTSTAEITFGATVFATSAKGPILEIAKDGTSIRQVATSPFTPIGIAIDSTNIYWVEDGQSDPATHCSLGNGRLMRVRR